MILTIDAGAWMMDDDSFGKLPDRSTLTGSPMPRTAYRDSSEPECIFRFYTQAGDVHWERYGRLRPAP